MYDQWHYILSVMYRSCTTVQGTCTWISVLYFLHKSTCYTIFSVQDYDYLSVEIKSLRFALCSFRDLQSFSAMIRYRYIRKTSSSIHIEKNLTYPLVIQFYSHPTRLTIIYNKHTPSYHQYTTHNKMNNVNY